MDYLLKNRERIQNVKETRDSRLIHWKKLHKACPQLEIAHGGFKDLHRRTASDKVLRDNVFNIAKNPDNPDNILKILKCDGYQRGPALMVYNVFDKKSAATHTVTGPVTPINFNSYSESQQ